MTLNFCQKISQVLTSGFMSSKKEVDAGYGKDSRMMTTTHKAQAFVLQYVLLRLGFKNNFLVNRK